MNRKFLHGLLLVTVFLLFNVLYSFSLTPDWFKYIWNPGVNDLGVAKWNGLNYPGVVGINMDPMTMLFPPPVFGNYPALLVHSQKSTTHECEVTGIIRLQSEQTIINQRGESKLEIWSNNYQSPFQWDMGEIRSINLGSRTTVPSGTFTGGLAFYSSGGPDIVMAQTMPQEVMRIIQGKAGIRLGPMQYGPADLGELPRSALDVRGTISTGGLDKLFSQYVDGTISFYPSGSGSWVHFDNRETGGFNISHGRGPGEDLSYEEALKHGVTDRPPKGHTDIINIYTWPHQVGIGCHVWPGPPHDYEFPTGSGIHYNMHPAGPTGMLTISDSRYPFWDFTENIYKVYNGNNVVLRVERRNAPPVEDNYKLISAGHNEKETFIVYPNGLVKIGDKNFNVSGSSLETPLQLSVDGAIATRELLITTEAERWPDYVFAKDYNLKDLNELEKDILNNGHLPDIPSQKEVKDQGVNIGEMQSMLLKKMEELTLYIIKINKEVQALKNENTSLKAKIIEN